MATVIPMDASRRVGSRGNSHSPIIRKVPLTVHQDSGGIGQRVAPAAINYSEMFIKLSRDYRSTLIFFLQYIYIFFFVTNHP